jgi:hypothetical protein
LDAAWGNFLESLYDNPAELSKKKLEGIIELNKALT